MSCTTLIERQKTVVITRPGCAERALIRPVSARTTLVSSAPRPATLVTRGVRGLPGFDVELQKTSTHVQWRLRKADEPWTDLVPLSELVGPASIKAGGILFSVAGPGPDWVLCDGSLYTGGGPLATALAGNGGYLPDFTGAQVPAYISKSVGATVGWVTDTDARLTDAREWTAATVDQAEAEAGTATTRRAWTAERVKQAIAAWWAGSAAKTALDGKVAGPASSVDGQVMVFSGASGKLARGIGKSDAEFGALYPSFNLIAANGTFGTMLSNGTVNTSSFSAPVAGPLAPSNGATWSAGAEFKYFETPRPTLFQDFASKISLGNMLCRAAKLTAGAGSAGGFTHTDGKSYTVATELNMSPAYPINGSSSMRLTFAVWVRAIDEDMIFWWRTGDSSIITRDSLSVASNSVQVVTPDDKWVHFCVSSRSFYAMNSYSPICLQSGKSAYFMLPVLIAADVRIPMHSFPCSTYTVY